MIDEATSIEHLHACLLFVADIDECRSDVDGCEDDCENTIGSFVCSCPRFGKGFKTEGTECVGMYCNERIQYVRCHHCHF